LCFFAQIAANSSLGNSLGHAIVAPVRAPTPSFSSAPVDVVSTAPPSAVRSQASTEDFPTNLSPVPRHGTAEAPPVDVLAWRAEVIASKLEIHAAVAQLRIAESRVAAAKKHYRVAVAQCLALRNVIAEDSEVQPTQKGAPVPSRPKARKLVRMSTQARRKQRGKRARGHKRDACKGRGKEKAWALPSGDGEEEIDVTQQLVDGEVEEEMYWWDTDLVE
jgi:hypothetical protein